MRGLSSFHANDFRLSLLPDRPHSLERLVQAVSRSRPRADKAWGQYVQLGLDRFQLLADEVQLRQIVVQWGFPERFGEGVCTGLSDFKLAIGISFKASSLSVFRLTFLHCQASSLVLQTRVASPSSRHRSCSQPLGPQASKTTKPTVWAERKLRKYPRLVGTVWKRDSWDPGSKKQHMELNWPRSIAEMGALELGSKFIVESPLAWGFVAVQFSSLATREDFARAILVDNCLGKRSSKTRQLSLRQRQVFRLRCAADRQRGDGSGLQGAASPDEARGGVEDAALGREQIVARDLAVPARGGGGLAIEPPEHRDGLRCRRGAGGSFPGDGVCGRRGPVCVGQAFGAVAGAHGMGLPFAGGSRADATTCKHLQYSREFKIFREETR